MPSYSKSIGRAGCGVDVYSVESGRISAFLSVFLDFSGRLPFFSFFSLFWRKTGVELAEKPEQPAAGHKKGSLEREPDCRSRGNQ